MSDWHYQPAKDLGLSESERLRSPRREAGLVSTVGHFCWGVLTRVYLRAWHRFTVIGTERLPIAPPFVMVANHTSHLDALVLAAPLALRLRDRVFALAAGDVFFESTAKAALSAGLINALPVWRRKLTPKGLAELRRRLVEEPCGYILFPEGTRSRDGTMAEFRAGVGMLLAGTDVPAIPCHLSGAHRALPAGCVCPRRVALTLRVGSALRFTDTPDDKTGWTRVAAELQAAVRALSGDA